MTFEAIEITLNKELELTQGFTIPSGSYCRIEPFNQIIHVSKTKYFVFPHFWHDLSCFNMKKALLSIQGVHQTIELDDENSEFTPTLHSTDLQLEIAIEDETDIDTLEKCKALVISKFAELLSGQGFLIEDFS